MIQSHARVHRHPVLAFFLSLLITGLGQMYNGDLARGLIYFFLRIINLLLIPAVLVLNREVSLIHFVTVMFVLHLIIIMITSADAFFSALRKPFINPGRVNSPLFYGLYSMLNILLLTLAILAVFSMISLERVKGTAMNPTFEEGEIILVNSLRAAFPQKGDVILYKNQGSLLIGRILAWGNDEVRFAGEALNVNGIPLSPGAYADDGERESLGLPNKENLFFETQGDRRYPILGLPKNNRNLARMRPQKIPVGSIFLLPDNRQTVEGGVTISTGMVAGIVEGIIFSSNYRRLCLRPYQPY